MNWDSLNSDFYRPPTRTRRVFSRLAFDWRYAPILASCNRTMQAKNHTPLRLSFYVAFYFIVFSLLFFLMLSFLFFCRLCSFFVIFPLFMSSLLFLYCLFSFMSSLLQILVVFVLFNWLRHLHKTGNRIINMWPNFLVSWSVVNWPSKRKKVLIK